MFLIASQFGGLGLLSVISIKIYRKIRLYEIKQEAMIYAIKKESKNGFAEAYDERLNELMNEYNFLKFK